MNRFTFRMLGAIVALTSSIAMAQGTGSASPPEKGSGAPAGAGMGMGPGSGMGMGPGSGKGMASDSGMRGRSQRFGSSNTSGWSLMTPEERTAHRDKMHGMKTLDECKSYTEEHHKSMEARSKDKGVKVPAAPRIDMCERMKQRGFFDQTPKK